MLQNDEPPQYAHRSYGDNDRLAVSYWTLENRNQRKFLIATRSPHEALRGRGCENYVVLSPQEALQVLNILREMEGDLAAMVEEERVGLEQVQAKAKIRSDGRYKL